MFFNFLFIDLQGGWIKLSRTLKAKASVRAKYGAPNMKYILLCF